MTESGGEKVDPIVAMYPSGLEPGQPQHFENLVVFPLFSPLDEGPRYVTLGQALKKGVLTVTEVHQSGSVPELKVTNKGKRRVLLLDGEELVGAKQNRVLNTTILLKKQSETVVPVSCTEQGRWSYVSDKFADSGVVMSPRMRVSKSQAVATSLEQSQRFRADQTQVWDEIEELSANAQVTSSTHAMRDVYQSKAGDLEKYMRAFLCLPHQRGLLAVIDGEVAGFDFLSRETAYKMAHPKLARSYALDALLQRTESGTEVSSSIARAFLDTALRSKGKKYESVGHGWDHRLEGEDLVGSALTFRNAVIHMAFFRSTAQQREERMARSRRRREFRASLEQRQVPMQVPFLGPEEALGQQAIDQDVDLTLEDADETQSTQESQA